MKPGCFVSCSAKDNCFGFSGRTVYVHNILITPTDEALVVYEDFEQSESLFSYPLQSSDIGIKVVHNLSGKLAVANVDDIGQKCVLIPQQSGFIVMPLLHVHC